MSSIQDANRAAWDAEREQLKSRLISCDTEAWQRVEELPDLRLVAGVDISFIVGDDVNACAGYVVLQLGEKPGDKMNVVYEDMEMIQLTAPYIPGYLAFREADPLFHVIDRQRRTHPELTPQVLLVDGNGLLHGHQFGLACHLGVLLDMPCIGVAKNLYQMNDEGILRDEDHQNSIDALRGAGDGFDVSAANGSVLATALRTTDASKKPVYVSIGHRINLDTSVKVVMRCSEHRVPEPTRQADIRSRVVARKFEEEHKKDLTVGTETAGANTAVVHFMK